MKFKNGKTLNLRELTADETAQVTGGWGPGSFLHAPIVKPTPLPVPPINHHPLVPPHGVIH